MAKYFKSVALFATLLFIVLNSAFAIHMFGNKSGSVSHASHHQAMQQDTEDKKEDNGIPNSCYNCYSSSNLQEKSCKDLSCSATTMLYGLKQGYVANITPNLYSSLNFNFISYISIVNTKPPMFA